MVKVDQSGRVPRSIAGRARDAAVELRQLAFPIRAFRPRTVVGIDVGLAAVKAVKIECRDGSRRLLGWSLKEFPPARRDGDSSVLGGRVRDALADVGGLGDHLALCLSGPEVRVHRLQLPDLPEKELPKAVAWQVQKELGGEGGDPAIGYEVQGRGSDGQESPCQILAISVPRTFIDSLLDTLEGLRVHRVGVTASAYSSLVAADGVSRVAGGYAVVDVGRDATWICLFRRDHLVYARRIGVAGSLFTQSLTQPVQTNDGPLRYSLAEAEQLKREKTLDLDGPAVDGKSPDYFSVLLGPAVERLCAEVERTLVHFVHADAGDPIERIYLSGGGSLLGGLPEAMSGGLRLSVERMDRLQPAILTEAVRGMEGERGLVLAGAVGTALGWSSEINLVPVRRRTTRSAAVVQTALFWGATLLLAGAPVLDGLIDLGTARWQARLEQANTRYATVQHEQAQMDELLKTERRIEAQRVALSRMPPEGRSVTAQILKALGERLPPGVVLNELWVDEGYAGMDAVPAERRMVLSGEVHGPAGDLEATLLEFVLRLRKSPFYKDLVVTRKKEILRGGERGLEFEVICALS